MRCGSFFSGIGLLDYGLHLAGLEHAWGCEQDEWRRKLWEQRFRAECHPDIRAFDVGWGRVDVVAGGFPCKGASVIGPRTGFGHPETVLWREMRRAISELGPRYVVIENVANILALHGGAVWGEVLGDMAALGFDVVWDCLPAAAVGAPHRRDRLIAVASLAAGEHQRAALDPANAEPGGRQPWPLSRVGGAGAAPDAERERGAGRRAPFDVAGAGGEAEGEARQRERGGDAADDRNADRRIPVDWGEYAPAIRRWEAVAGAAPEPLLRRVDDRRTSRLELARLSALGDGVQVQVGQLAGCHIVELERQRLMREAA